MLLTISHRYACLCISEWLLKGRIMTHVILVGKNIPLPLIVIQDAIIHRVLNVDALAAVWQELNTPFPLLFAPVVVFTTPPTETVQLLLGQSPMLILAHEDIALDEYHAIVERFAGVEYLSIYEGEVRLAEALKLFLQMYQFFAFLRTLG